MEGELLLVEDDDGIAAPLARTLSREGYVVTRVGTGREALEHATRSPPAMVVLDLGLPDMDGLEVCRSLRADGVDAPVLILTARGSELDQVVGLDAGADDYLAKPFSLSVLLARVRALLRRRASNAAAPAGPSAPAGLRIDEPARRAWIGDRELSLTTKEFDVLALAMRHEGTVVTRERFMEEVWDEHWSGSTKTLDMHVSSLRRKLAEHGEDPACIVTLRGYGYRYDPPGV